ncbi:hypothetical protein ACFTWS_36800 [Streptomyces sp. NPDC057027]|uniref:hypothetical protein n=1 Tax=Streptomyces sp. NPDC057027 TaxID=3346004 RepID=UPI00362DCD19
MSIVIKFFVAPDAEAAAAVAEGGPDGVFESLTFGNFDAEEALIEWEGIFTGRSFEEALDDVITPRGHCRSTSRVGSTAPQRFTRWSLCSSNVEAWRWTTTRSTPGLCRKSSPGQWPTVCASSTFGPPANSSASSEIPDSTSVPVPSR